MEYIPNTKEDQEAMLQTIGLSSMEELFSDIPKEVRLKRLLKLPRPLSEMELIQELQAMSEQNADLDHYACFLGAGAYDHFIPSVVPQLIFRSELYTSYTPYQAEISQGVLQSIFEYQTMICELTGMEVSNASLYDGGSALAEAAMMALRITKRSTILVSNAIHPYYRAVLRTYLSGSQVRIVEIPWADGVSDLSALKNSLTLDVAAVLIQSPNFFGCIEDLEAISPRVHEVKALFVVSADPISLGILEAPGQLGADVVVGEGQGLGNAVNFGGPYLGFFSTRKEYVRQIPGRLVGATVDAQGRTGYCLTLQTREQHIKRERATSNICTSESLNAIAATVYLAAMGREGFKEVGRLCLQKAHTAQSQISRIKGFQPAFTAPFFKEFVIKTRVTSSKINQRLLKERIIGGLDLGLFDPRLKNHLLFCVTEKRTKEEIARLVRALKTIR
jgi:glycine cleavage system P protein (glycine dehydrogenase) subunit 1